MYHEPIQNFRDLPVLQSHRKRTDVFCSIFAIVFALTMFITACVKFNKSNLLKINFPTDKDGRTCGFDLPGYPYLYLLSPFSSDVSLRLCVSVCPTANDTTIQCSAVSSISCNDSRVMVYPSHPQVNRLGGYCIPDDSNTYTKAMYSYNLKEKINFMKSYDTVKLSALIALLLGVLYMLLVQWTPRMMEWLVVVFAIGSCLALAILLFADASPSIAANKGWAVAIGVMLVVIGLGLVLNLIWLRYGIKVSGIFLEYSTRFLSHNKFMLWWIVVFLLMGFALVALTMFQALAFSSSATPVLDRDDVYWNGPGLTCGLVLVFVEFIWGISFLRDAFNYIISGYAVRWYFTQARVEPYVPYQRLLKFNFGSVIGGSLANALLFLPDLFLSLFRFQTIGCCAQICSCLHRSCYCCMNLFELARSDAYGYMHLAGPPYCNSARQAQYLCSRSRLFPGSESTNKIYRLSAHLFLTTIVLCICYGVQKSRLVDHDVSLRGLVFIVLVTLLIIPYFICLHADAADALMVTYLAEEHLVEMDPLYVDKAPRGLRRDLETIARSRPSVIYG